MADGPSGNQATNSFKGKRPIEKDSVSPAAGMEELNARANIKKGVPLAG